MMGMAAPGTTGHFWARLRARVLGVAPQEALFSYRGFSPAASARQAALEHIGSTFLEGYNCAVRTCDMEAVAGAARAFDTQDCGFFFEGAAMGFAILDILAPRRLQLFAQFIRGVGRPHIYMAYVGAGLAFARTSQRLQWRLGPLDPMLAPLMVDGFGFHAGYFHHRWSVECQARPRGLRTGDYASFDQGLGRAIWFVAGADVERAAAMVHAFQEQRWPDLWSGVGLAATYAGSVEAGMITQLRQNARALWAHVAQGSAFAVTARARAATPAAHSDMACNILCRSGSSVVVRMVNAARMRVLSRRIPSQSAYEAWRAEVRHELVLLTRQGVCA